MRKGESKYYPFEKAREMIREEHIGSVAMFRKWYKFNKPCKLPQRPDIIYKSQGWRGWNDFLGNNNPFLHAKKNFVSYEEAKKWARTLGLSTYAEWMAYVKGGNKPENIPARPDYVYRDWFSWKDFLGTNLKQLAREAVRIIPILFVMKVPGTPSNVFKVDVTHGGKEFLIGQAQIGCKIVASFEYTTQLDWRALLSNYGNNYWHGDADDYAFTNLNQFLFEISNYLSPVKF